MASGFKPKHVINAVLTINPLQMSFKVFFLELSWQNQEINKLLRLGGGGLLKEKGKQNLNQGGLHASTILLEYKLSSLPSTKCLEVAVFCPERVTGRPHLHHGPGAHQEYHRSFQQRTLLT